MISYYDESIIFNTSYLCACDKESRRSYSIKPQLLIEIRPYTFFLNLVYHCKFHLLGKSNYTVLLPSQKDIKKNLQEFWPSHSLNVQLLQLNSVEHTHFLYSTNNQKPISAAFCCLVECSRYEALMLLAIKQPLSSKYLREVNQPARLHHSLWSSLLTAFFFREYIGQSDLSRCFQEWHLHFNV